MISLLNMSYGLPGGVPLFEKVNAHFEKGERIGILANSGTGKTVLAKLLSGAETSTSGYVITKGRVSWPIGYAGVFHPELTGGENVSLLADLVGEDVDEMIEWCYTLGHLGHMLNKKLKLYTPAERAMLAYCCSLSVPCDWYIADEKITVGRGAELERCEKSIALRLENSGLIFISKNASQIKKYCNRFYAIINGDLVAFDDIAVAEKALSLWLEANRVGGLSGA